MFRSGEAAEKLSCDVDFAMAPELSLGADPARSSWCCQRNYHRPALGQVPGCLLWIAGVVFGIRRTGQAQRPDRTLLTNPRTFEFDIISLANHMPSDGLECQRKPPGM